MKDFYGKYKLTDEIIGYPMMVWRFLKGSKLEVELEKRRVKAKENADKVILTNENRDEYRIEYNKLNNVFSYYFKDIEVSRYINLDKKVTYCLSQFKKELRLVAISGAKTTVLRSKFLIGAEKTLTTYFILGKNVTDQKRLKDIIIGADHNKINEFLDFLRNSKYIDENNNFSADNKSFFIRIHRFLYDENIINPDIQKSTIIKIMNYEYNNEFNEGIFGRFPTAKSGYEDMVFNKVKAIFSKDSNMK